MQHDDYVRSLVDNDVARQWQLNTARAVQDFDAAIAMAMDVSNSNVDQLAELTRIPLERLEDLLDGDSPYLEEIVVLCRALNLDVYFDRSARLHVAMWPASESRNRVYHFGHGVEHSLSTTAAQPVSLEVHYAREEESVTSAS